MFSKELSVIRWAEDLLGAPVHAVPLEGGANNHLFHCQGASGELVIKQYRDQNFGAEVSRRDAEVAFLKHAAKVTPGFVPKILAESPYFNMIAMAVVEGVPFCNAEDISLSDVTAAIQFYRQLNQDRDAVSNYQIAAREGYRSISEHLRHVEQRVSSLTMAHLPRDFKKSGKSAIDNIRHSFDIVRGAIESQILSGGFTDAIASDCLQLSPGDFGFHNAIRSVQGPVFLDFEYAGLDDPAKTLSDFFLQPKVAICPALLSHVTTGFAVHSQPCSLKRRAKYLGAILSIKWKVIILAPLDPARFSSFQTRYGSDLSGELARRLELVKRKTVFE